MTEERFCSYCGRKMRYGADDSNEMLWVCPKWGAILEHIKGEAWRHDLIPTLKKAPPNFDTKTGKRL